MHTYIILCSVARLCVMTSFGERIDDIILETSVYVPSTQKWPSEIGSEPHQTTTYICAIIVNIH